MNKPAYGVIIFLLGCAVAQASEMIYTPPNMVYDPSSYIISAEVPNIGGHALPPGTGGLIVAFAQLLGVIAVWKSLSMAHSITNTGSSSNGDKGWMGCIVMFVAGVCVYHLERTMGTLAETFPGFPDLTRILQY